MLLPLCGDAGLQRGCVGRKERLLAVAGVDVLPAGLAPLHRLPAILLLRRGRRGRGSGCAAGAACCGCPLGRRGDAARPCVGCAVDEQLAVAPLYRAAGCLGLAGHWLQRVLGGALLRREQRVNGDGGATQALGLDAQDCRAVAAAAQVDAVEVAPLSAAAAAAAAVICVAQGLHAEHREAAELQLPPQLLLHVGCRALGGQRLGAFEDNAAGARVLLLALPQQLLLAEQKADRVARG